MPHENSSTARSNRLQAEVLAGVLDLLSRRLAILDHEGVIIFVNRAWREFAAANGGTASAVGEGADYLAACEAAMRDGDEYAARFARGLRAVLRGLRTSFSHRYPCHSPTEDRWFIAHVYRLPSDGRDWIVVAHEPAGPRDGGADGDADRDQDSAPEIERLQSVFIAPTSVAARIYGSGPLREVIPALFGELVERVAALLDSRLEQRAYKVGRTPELPGDVAATLGRNGAGPRDVVDLYKAALEGRTRRAAPRRAQAYVEEGRLLVLELMGDLAAFYRAQRFAPPSTSRSTSGADRPRETPPA
jgi:hypothetical protein